MGARAQAPERSKSFNAGDKVRFTAVDGYGTPGPTAIIPTLEEARAFLLEYEDAAQGWKRVNTAGLVSVGHNTLATFQTSMMADDVDPPVELAFVKIAQGPLRGIAFWVPMRRLRADGAPDPAWAVRRKAQAAK
jgi:hypothetical protein